MDFGTILFYLFGIISALYVLHLGFYLTGASFYDVWQLRRNKNGEYLGKLYHPLVTVLIPAHNEEKVIERCLDSVANNTYKHVQIIVIDDASQDNTYSLAKKYAKTHPDVWIRSIRKKTNSGKGDALNYALRRYTKGNLVMTLDADSILAPHALARAVTYFENPIIAGVAANVQLINHFTILGVLQKFEHMIGYRSKKVYSLTNCEFVVGGVASVYRMDVLRAVGFYDTDTLTEDIGLSMKVITNGNRAYRVVYGADVRAMTEPVDSFRGLLRQRYRWKYGSLQNIRKYYHLIGKNDTRFTRTLTFYRMPMAILSEVALLLTPLMWGYIVYITIMNQSLFLLIGAYLTITTYTFLTLWHDEHLRFRDRLHLNLYVPIAYFIFYIMDLIQFLAALGCTLRIHHLVRRKRIATTWISPKRLGMKVTGRQINA